MPAPSGTVPFRFSRQVSDARRFYLEFHGAAATRKRAAGGAGFSVIAGGWEECLPEYDLERPGFPYLILEMVSRGCGEVTLQGKSHPLEPGTLFVYGRGIPHRITASATHGMTKYFVAVTGAGAASLLREGHLLPAGALRVLHHDQLRPIFDDLIGYGLGDHADRRQRCNVAFHYLILKIADLALPSTGPHTAAAATYRRCRQFIEENFLTVHSLREVAAACHVDSAYLCRIFRRFRRQTPFQYLQHLQMNFAADLLQSGRHTVGETADRLGFSDPYNFSRAFKRVFGIAPAHLLRKP
ncbi:MAG TPA: AraC family transcriptional regulator [Chthoniobacteraceae bacterium]|nr:AraC family transcriptional regulator [Chthoniobacteraceae bacterium]